MGNMIAKNYQNYVLPVLARQPTALQNVSLPPSSSFYSYHYIPEQFLVPTYFLGSKKQVVPSVLQSQVFKKPQSLTLLTYNVWFEGFNVDSRYDTLMKMLDESGADIICLQEVNQDFNKLIHGATKKYKNLQNYYLSVMKMHWYDIVILSRYPCRFYKKTFSSSSMGRCVLTVVIEFAEENDKKEDSKFVLGVNCVHLQSLNYPEERMSQLKQIDELNAKIDFSIIAGDFNFSDEWPQNKAIEAYNDVWKTGKRHFNKFATQQMMQTGFTMPCNGRFPVWRPDHVIYKTKNSINKSGEKGEDEIQIIGNFTIHPFEKEVFDDIQKDGQVRTPSDHFGIMTKISL